jgi:pyruvate/2-oxoglutarate dehydrogenase complex dihydrolipoamide dehydrogenase (E3) component
MADTLLTPDICVIGGGPAGFLAAAGAARLGAETILVEKGGLGGALLHGGAVSAKALVLAARRGLSFAEARARAAAALAEFSLFYAPERLAALGARLIRAEAVFEDADTVRAGGTLIRARRFILAPGAAAPPPDLPDLKGIPRLDPAGLAALDSLPQRLCVAGGGPEAVELAHAFRLFGSEVTLLAPALLPGEDAEAVALLSRALAGSGIDIRPGAAPELSATHLLVLPGSGAEAPSLPALAADNPRVLTAGDALARRVFSVGGASDSAGAALKSALFRMKSPRGDGLSTRAVLSALDLAQAGATEAELSAIGIPHRILRAPFSDTDGARLEGGARGFVKAMVTPRGKVLGATILGPGAAELIAPWSLAVERGLPVSALAGLSLPWGGFGEASKKAAHSFLLPRLFSPRNKMLARLLARLG